MEKEERIEKILDSIYDPEVGESVLKSGMVTKYEIKRKLVRIWLRPLHPGCAGCFIINAIIGEIQRKIEEMGYEAEVNFDFDEE